MFEIRCLVGDKKLSDVLHILKGHTFGLPTILPHDDDAVVSSSELNGAERAAPAPKHKAGWKPSRKRPLQHGGKHLKGLGSTAVVRDLIEKSGITSISSREMKKATVAAGYSTGAYSHAIKILLTEGLLRPLNTIGDYEVVRQATAA